MYDTSSEAKGNINNTSRSIRTEKALNSRPEWCQAALGCGSGYPLPTRVLTANYCPLGITKLYD